MVLGLGAKTNVLNLSISHTFVLFVMKPQNIYSLHFMLLGFAKKKSSVLTVTFSIEMGLLIWDVIFILQILSYSTTGHSFWLIYLKSFRGTQRPTHLFLHMVNGHFKYFKSKLILSATIPKSHTFIIVTLLRRNIFSVPHTKRKQKMLECCWLYYLTHYN